MCVNIIVSVFILCGKLFQLTLVVIYGTFSERKCVWSRTVDLKEDCMLLCQAVYRLQKPVLCLRFWDIFTNLLIDSQAIINEAYSKQALY